MQHYRSIEHFDLDATWATIGSFDGIHNGHQYLIRQMVRDAREHNAASAVITFSPHPAVYLQKISYPFYLTSPDEKLKYLERLGIDYVLTLEFNEQLASMEAEEFVQKLSYYLGMRHLWVGKGFALGKGRKGNVPFLQSISEKYQFEIRVVDPIQISGMVVSSTFIRDLIRKGKVDEVKTYLGRDYSVSGVVIHGDHRGKTLGFPTANLQCTSQRLIPYNGIYATWAKIDGKSYPSVTNVGIRPTFQSTDLVPRIETHIIGYDHNIYGCELDIEFISFLRQELHFANVEALIDQMKVDVKNSSKVLSHAA